MLLLLAVIVSDRPPPAGAQVRPGEHVSIAVSRAMLSAPLYVARAQNFFAGEGLAVVIDDCLGGTRCVARMFRDESDMATASEAVVMFKSFERADFAIVATFVTTRKDLKVVVSSDRGVTRIEDLRGRTVATVLGSSAHYFLETALILHGVDPDSVKIVGLLPADTPAALKSAAVDAIAIWEPFAGRAIREAGGREVPNPSTYRETFNLLAKKTSLSQRAETVVKILRALDRAIAFMGSNERESKAIVKLALDVDDPSVDRLWTDVQFRLALDQALISTLEGQARWAMRRKLVAGPLPNYLRLLHLPSLESVKPGAITVIR